MMLGGDMDNYWVNIVDASDEYEVAIRVNFGVICTVYGT